MARRRLGSRIGAASLASCLTVAGLSAAAVAALPAHVCHLANAVGFVAHVSVAGLGHGYATATLYSRERGDRVIEDLRREASERTLVRGAATGPGLMALVTAREARAEASLGGANASQAQRLAAFERELGEDRSAAGDAGVVIPVSKDGAIRCDGISEGSYDLLATVARRDATGTSQTIYAAKFDVPATNGKRRTVFAIPAMARVTVI